ncbi:MAG TPA: NAD(P)H-dependent oxidoreductase [Tepidisphaeraceae bacterium]|nr:NAD(P)H-dependent oxidoreductase [Tepidisphaeraceae bacterium]
MTTLNDFVAAHGAPSQHEVLKHLNWRYATKRFDPSRRLSSHDLETLKKAVTLAPSSFGLQPWKFFVVTDPDVRKELRAAAWDQPQIVEASHLVVLATRQGLGPADIQRHIDHIARTRGVPAESLSHINQMMLGFVSGQPREKVDAWAARQVYIALGVLLSTAAMLGIDACPMEGFEPEKFNEILGLGKHGYSATVLCALGYRAADDQYANMKKVRFPTEEVVVHI